MKTIRSVLGSAKDPANALVMVRLDHDDEESMDRMEEIASLATVIVGHRGKGYPDLHLMYTDLAEASDAQWVWIMNDDATVIGKWDVGLASVPLTGFIVQPEFVGNGPSIYPHCEGGPFPIVPNGCWEDYGSSSIPDPADTGLDHLLRIQIGWKTQFLAGVTVGHDRDTDDKLAVHRKL